MSDARLRDAMMSPTKVIAIDVWGDYACYRRGYTTTSPLTYPIPPRTALVGLISAILGKEKDLYWEFFQSNKTLFGVQLLSPIKKARITQNLIDTKLGWNLKETKGQRTQIPFEYLKNPRYRIFFWTSASDELETLKEFVSNHKSIYTPYLGLSECIANFEFVGEFTEIHEKSAGENGVDISTVISGEDFQIKIEHGKKYGKVRIPHTMNTERVVTKFIEILYEENGNPITITKGNYYELSGNGMRANVVLF
ncbi:MAG: type I-B CRISPR-associated protein Cas5b [Methanomassiliicoccales archaeon]|jgi:CRISPR-associated protein Cas5h